MNVSRFGSREICDVTFKAIANNQKVGNKEFKAGQPVFTIDTATASNMEQGSTPVYANGGKGYNRLIAWEGEKTLTFTVTDALMSPLGLAVLTGAGFAADEDAKHIHVTYDLSLNAEGEGVVKFEKLAEEIGVSSTSTIQVCYDSEIVPYATILDHNGGIIGWSDTVEFSGTESDSISGVIEVKAGQNMNVTVADAANHTVKLDFYVRMTSGATHITIGPNDFGGYFYVEADTLYRNQDGKDMAATLTFPKVKIQSGFTIAMAPNGDPSTFDFVMDAFPAYTYFNPTKKVVCDMVIIGGEDAEESVSHTEPVAHKSIDFVSLTYDGANTVTGVIAANGISGSITGTATYDGEETTSAPSVVGNKVTLDLTTESPSKGSGKKVVVTIAGDSLSTSKTITI